MSAHALLLQILGYDRILLPPVRTHLVATDMDIVIWKYVRQFPKQSFNGRIDVFVKRIKAPFVNPKAPSGFADIFFTPLRVGNQPRGDMAGHI